MQHLTDRIILGLTDRINGAEGQSAQTVGNLIVNIAYTKLNAKRLTDVPFNIGSSFDSQSLLQEVRRQPTGE